MEQKVKKPRKATKRYKVIENPELRQALNSYRPQFGNDEDIRLLKRLDDHHRELEKVDNEVLRGIRAKHVLPVPLNAAMKRLLANERSLISSVISRNMDF